MPLPTERDRAFVRQLVRLADPERRDGRAALAALRRGLGKSPGEAPEMFPYIASFDHEHGWASDVLYLVAALFAAHPANWEGDGKDDRRTNLGASLRLAQGESEGMERRFIALLNSRRDDLPVHLRHVVGLCHSGEREVPIDWAQLLRDLRDWDREDRRVQRNWAWSFWREQPTEEPEPAGAGSATS